MEHTVGEGLIVLALAAVGIAYVTSAVLIFYVNAN